MQHDLAWAGAAARLTTYEYNNTIRDLLNDTTQPGNSLPAQVDSKQNLFGNDADEQSPSPLLIEKYQSVAESVARQRDRVRRRWAS